MSKPMLLWQSILVALQVVFGASAATDSILNEFMGERWVGLLVLVTAALQAATAFYQRGGTVAADKGDN